MTETLFGYVILISKEFFRFYLSILFLVFLSMEKVHKSLKTGFDHCASYFQFSSVFGNVVLKT